MITHLFLIFGLIKFQIFCQIFYHLTYVCPLGCFTKDVKAPGGYIEGEFQAMNSISVYDCQVKKCRASPGCEYFMYINDGEFENQCFLKTRNSLARLNHAHPSVFAIFGPGTCTGMFRYT